MGKPITMDQLRQDVGNMVEKITKVIAIFRQFQLKMEEYVCLKVIAMVSQDGKYISDHFWDIHQAWTGYLFFISKFKSLFFLYRSWRSKFVRYSRQIPDLFTNVYKKAFPFSAKQGRRVASQITRGNVTIHFNFFHL